jgi:hypothetical protein
MSHETSRQPLAISTWKCKDEAGKALGPDAEYLSIILPDDSLAAIGYLAGEDVTILVGDIWQGDLAAILTASGDWCVGFLFFFEAGVRVSTSRSDTPPRYYHLDQIAASGRVVRHGVRRVVQAGITLPTESVDRIRFRFRM